MKSRDRVRAIYEKKSERVEAERASDGHYYSLPLAPLTIRRTLLCSPVGASGNFIAASFLPLVRKRPTLTHIRHRVYHYFLLNPSALFNEARIASRPHPRNLPYVILFHIIIAHSHCPIHEYYVAFNYSQDSFVIFVMHRCIVPWEQFH